MIETKIVLGSPFLFGKFGDDALSFFSFYFELEQHRRAATSPQWQNAAERRESG